MELGSGRYHAAVPLRLERDDEVAWIRLTSFRQEVYDQEAVRSAFAELVANPAALPVRVLHGDSVREITGGARRARRVPLGDRLRRQQSDGPVQHVSGFRNHDVRPGW